MTVTTREVQDRLFAMGVGRFVDLPESGVSAFVSGRVAIGRTVDGFIVYVHEQSLVKQVRAVFDDTSGQVMVKYMSRPKPLEIS